MATSVVPCRRGGPGEAETRWRSRDGPLVAHERADRGQGGEKKDDFDLIDTRVARDAVSSASPSAPGNRESLTTSRTMPPRRWRAPPPSPAPRPRRPAPGRSGRAAPAHAAVSVACANSPPPKPISMRAEREQHRDWSDAGQKDHGGEGEGPDNAPKAASDGRRAPRRASARRAAETDQRCRRASSAVSAVVAADAEPAGSGRHRAPAARPAS